MSTAAKAHEPTMEEILASIRRIISDDEPSSTPLARNAPKAAEAAPDPDAGSALGQDDIDAMLASFDAPPPPKAEPKLEAPERARPKPRQEEPDDLDVLELTDAMAESESVVPEPEFFAPKPTPAPAPEAAAAPRQAPAPDRLLSPHADDAVTNAFGSLAHTILSQNARTLDDVVKDLLRPMLRSWLDDNLPPLVERLVRQEIERVARGGR
jgi:cell pole-organizing protein PopZ